MSHLMYASGSRHAPFWQQGLTCGSAVVIRGMCVAGGLPHCCPWLGPGMPDVRRTGCFCCSCLAYAMVRCSRPLLLGSCWMIAYATRFGTHRMHIHFTKCAGCARWVANQSKFEKWSICAFSAPETHALQHSVLSVTEQLHWFYRLALPPLCSCPFPRRHSVPCC